MYKNILTFVLLIMLSVINIIAQENRLLNKLDSSSRSQRVVTAQLVFNDIEAAISGGNIAVLSKFFSSQTYFSLSNGISGYYSSNQAYYVLADFLRIYNVNSFQFKNIKADNDNPYATGIYLYEFKGKKDSAQVYISLKYYGGSWKITQITIN